MKYPGSFFVEKCIFRDVRSVRLDCSLTLPYITYSRQRDGSLRLPASRLGNGPASGPASLAFVRSKTRFSKERLRLVVSHSVFSLCLLSLKSTALARSFLRLTIAHSFSIKEYTSFVNG